MSQLPVRLGWKVTRVGLNLEHRGLANLIVLLKSSDELYIPRAVPRLGSSPLDMF